MAQVNLLKSLPRTTRDVNARATKKSPEIISEAKRYGKLYFDGPREYGYGGYKDDGRWGPVAGDIIEHYGLGKIIEPRPRVLDVGCAKGFLVKELVARGMDAYGLDISLYAARSAPDCIVGRIHKGWATHLPFPDKSFDLVLTINVIHNLKRSFALRAIREVVRVSKGPAFIQVDSYHTPAQKKRFEEWVLTAEFHDYPAGWLKLFEEAGYTGDYDWTVVE